MTLVPFCLFHGTSTAFLSSILARGLGACDPVSSAKGVQCLGRLIPLADKYLSNQESWLAERLGMEAMGGQRVTGGNMNFRHGSTYCSPSEETAVRYALSNSHGSELLSSCISLYNRLCTDAPTQVSFVKDDFPEIYSLALTNPTPVLLTIRDVPANSLLTEQGENAAEQISTVVSARDPVARALLQQCNFALVAPVPSAQLMVARIVAGSFSTGKLEYQLLPHDGTRYA